MISSEISKPRGYWEFWAEDARRTGSQLYARLAAVIAEDDALKALAARAQKGQPHANMILGAVHFLLLRGVDHPLKRFYATLGGGAKVDEDDPYPDFRDFVLGHENEVARLIEARVTNTNEVARSSVLHPGFRAIADACGAPLHLVEVGPSAGLNLIWDRYGVRYTRDGSIVASVSPNAELILDCELKGERMPPMGKTPAVASRVGLELNPVDLANKDDRDWLRALIWPDEVARMQRFERALMLAEKARPEIRKGDALELLPHALAAVPANETACVYHTIAVYQFSKEMRDALESILIVAGLRRPVARLSLEYNGLDAELTSIRYADGVRDERMLAISHPHGRWLEWRA
jgi:hypothetical protein